MFSVENKNNTVLMTTLEGNVFEAKTLLLLSDEMIAPDEVIPYEVLKGILLEDNFFDDKTQVDYNCTLTKNRYFDEWMPGMILSRKNILSGEQLLTMTNQQVTEHFKTCR